MQLVSDIFTSFRRQKACEIFRGVLNVHYLTRYAVTIPLRAKLQRRITYGNRGSPRCIASQLTYPYLHTTIKMRIGPLMFVVLDNSQKDRASAVIPPVQILPRILVPRRR